MENVSLFAIRHSLFATETHALRRRLARRDPTADGPRPAREPPRQAGAQGPRLLGLVPLPQGKIAILQGGERAAALPLFRLRRGWRCLQMADRNRRAELP